MVDIGINLVNKRFYWDLVDVIQRALDADVSKMIITGVSSWTSERALALAQQYEGHLFCTSGIHPHNAREYDPSVLEKIEELSNHKEVVAIGECGLDFNRNFSTPTAQENCFISQIELAIEKQKPLFLP